MSLLPAHGPLLDAQNSHQARFRDWAGTDAPEIWGPNLFNHDFSRPGPYVARVFHGTTHQFSAFDAKQNACPTGAFGRVHYFTSCCRDAMDHYARVGPDLENRINNEADKIDFEIASNPENYGLESDADDDAIAARALEIAKERLDGGEEILLELHVRFDRPFVIGSSTPYKYMLFDDRDCIYDTALKQVIEEHGLDPETEINDLPGDLEYLYQETCFELSERQFEELQCAMMRAARRLGTDLPDLPDRLLEDGYQITHDTLDKAIREAEDFALIQDEEGNTVPGDFLAKTVEELGYDAIILMDAAKRFKSMAIGPKTTHIHIFDSGKNRIKSIQNPGLFDPYSSNIYA